MSLKPWTPPPEVHLLDAANRLAVERYISELLDDQLASSATAGEPVVDVESELRIDALRAAFAEAQELAKARR